MLPIADYHMHTPLCGHAQGQPWEYAQQAVAIGLEEIGFSDHAPMVTGPMPGVTMERSQLSDYYAILEDVRKTFRGKLRIKTGIEADYIPGYEAKTREIVEDYPYDYVIGSVHFIGEWGFDHPDQRDRWSQKDVNQVYRTYYRLLRESAQTGLYNIIGHSDLVKKFGHRPTVDLSEELRQTADVFKQAGVAVEINTSGLRKPVGEIYPALENLKIFCQAGVPLTFGSDAHRPDEVGCDFDKGYTLAKQAGYTEYVLFKNKTIERSVSL